MKNLFDGALSPKFKIHLETKRGGVQSHIEGDKASCLTALSMFIRNLREAGVSDELLKQAMKKIN